MFIVIVHKTILQDNYTAYDVNDSFNIGKYPVY